MQFVLPPTAQISFIWEQDISALWKHFSQLLLAYTLWRLSWACTNGSTFPLLVSGSSHSLSCSALKRGTKNLMDHSISEVRKYHRERKKLESTVTPRPLILLLEYKRLLHILGDRSVPWLHFSCCHPRRWGQSRTYGTFGRGNTFLICRFNSSPNPLQPRV